MSDIKHVVMMSGGIGSFATAKRVIDKHGRDGVVLLFADTKAEDPDLYRFLEEAAELLAVPLVKVADGRTIWELFRDQKIIGNSRIAPCSKFLKQIPCRKWLEANTSPDTATVYVGIDWMETHRLPAIQQAYLPYKAEAPLTEPPFHDKEQMIAEAAGLGLRPPRLYEQGFPHNNCGGACVRGGQKQWMHLLEKNPALYADWEREENAFRKNSGKDVAILRDRRGGTVKPLPLTVLRARAEGRDEASVDQNDWGGCGCFTDFEEAAP